MWLITVNPYQPVNKVAGNTVGSRIDELLELEREEARFNRNRDFDPVTTESKDEALVN